MAAFDQANRASGLDLDVTTLMLSDFWRTLRPASDAGNDTLEKLAGNSWQKLTVRYWDALAGVVVDLAAGAAQDGWGTTDKLINIDDVHSGGNNDRQRRLPA